MEGITNFSNKLARTDPKLLPKIALNAAVRTVKQMGRKAIQETSKNIDRSGETVQNIGKGMNNFSKQLSGAAKKGQVKEFLGDLVKKVGMKVCLREVGLVVCNTA